MSTTLRTLALNASGGTVDPAGGLSITTYTTTVTLTRAQILALFATPVTLVAGAAGQVIVPKTVTAKLSNPGPGTAFADGGLLTVGYPSGPTATITGSTAIVTTALAAAYVVGSPTIGSGTVDLRGLALTLTNGTAAFTGGATNSTLAVTVEYSLLTGQ